MRTTTMLEVMAEVGALARHHADVYDKTGPVEALRCLRDHVGAARSKAAHERREHLTQAAAWALLALHAHDVEAAEVSTVDRSGHAAGCDVSADRTWCVFGCPAIAATLAARATTEVAGTPGRPTQDGSSEPHGSDSHHSGDGPAKGRV